MEEVSMGLGADDPIRRRAPAGREDEGVVGDAPRRGDHASLDGIDRRDLVPQEGLLEVPRHPLVGETDRARLFQAGDDLVDVGQELEVRLPVDEGHRGTVLEGSRRPHAREPAADDQDSLPQGPMVAALRARNKL